jgi:signal transduction histidine kinase
LQLDDVKGSETGELAVFDLAREALSNAVAHAHATQISIRLLQADGRIRLVIADNGVGFTPHVAYAKRSSGLWRMRELIESVGGDVAVVTHPGEGSVVVAAVPIEA